MITAIDILSEQDKFEFKHFIRLQNNGKHSQMSVNVVICPGRLQALTTFRNKTMSVFD